MQIHFHTADTNQITQSRRIMNTPSEFARDHLLYIQEAGALTSLRPHINKRENLQSYLFFIVLDGKGLFCHNNIPYHLTKGDCIFADCMHPHSHESSVDFPWQLMWVHFNGKLASTYYDYFINKNNSVYFCTETPLSFSDIITDLLVLYEKEALENEIIASKLLTDLTTSCITMLTHNHKLSNTTEKIQQIRNYLDQNFNLKITLDDLSAVYYVSKFHLSREFKRVYGVTISEYLLNRRITYGKTQLRFTDKTSEEISKLCGFHDADYFSKVFKRSEGMTVREYKKSWQQSNLKFS